MCPRRAFPPVEYWLGVRPIQAANCRPFLNSRALPFRVVHDGAAPDGAWENVNTVWVPDEHWKDFARTVLKRHKIEYDPF